MQQSEANERRALEANGPQKPLDWPTLILILVTGGGNWIATQNNRGQIDYGREQVIRQVNDLHSSLDDFEKRQVQSLENQNIMMRSDRDLLNQTHQITVRLENYKHLEQMRGAP